MSAHIHLQEEGPLALVTLSHPGKLNAMNRAMWRALRAVFTRIQQGPWRCVLLQGEGGHFCAGGDIAEYPAFRFDPERLRDFHEQDVWGGLAAMLACDVPIVAALAGNCMGAGLELACCADIRLAASDARFGAPIAKLGFPMAPREAQLVAREAGLATARQMLLEAAVLPAAELHARGFLHAVLPPADLPAQARQRAERIAALAPQAARLNKQTLRALHAQASAPDLPEPLRGLAPYAYAPSAEHREGVHAFIAKRPPQF